MIRGQMVGEKWGLLFGVSDLICLSCDHDNQCRCLSGAEGKRKGCSSKPLNLKLLNPYFPEKILFRS